MAGNIELGDHADAAVARVFNHVADLVLGIEIAVRAHLLELGIELTFHAKALIVGEVPVKHIELHGGHGVEVALDDFEGHPVARHIQHQAAPGEARAVFDVDGRGRKTARAFGDQLHESSHAVHARRRWWRL